MKKLLSVTLTLLLFLLSACVHETIGGNLEKPIAIKSIKHPCETFYRSASVVTEEYSRKMILSYKVQVKNKKGFLACEKLVQNDLDKVCESGKYSGIDLQFVSVNMNDSTAYKKGDCQAKANSKLKFVATTKMRLRVPASFLRNDAASVKH